MTRSLFLGPPIVSAYSQVPVWSVTQSCLTPVILWTVGSRASLSMGERAPESFLFFYHHWGFQQMNIYLVIRPNKPNQYIKLLFTCGTRSLQQLDNSLAFRLSGTIGVLSGGSISLLGIRTFKYSEFWEFGQKTYWLFTDVAQRRVIAISFTLTYVFQLTGKYPHD